jgi:hypothetical protein
MMEANFFAILKSYTVYAPLGVAYPRDHFKGITVSTFRAHRLPVGAWFDLNQQRQPTHFLNKFDTAVDKGLEFFDTVKDSF